jgi:hypothetical protein
MRSTPLHAPNGVTNARGDTERFAGIRKNYAPADGTRAEDRHDDGLVHNHGWAVSGKFDTVAKAVSGGTFSISAFPGSTKPRELQDHEAVQANDHHDDGLVHNHEWAVSGK